MVKKGQMNTAWMVKCKRLHCETNGRVESIGEMPARLWFISKGWTFDEKGLWTCHNRLGYHETN